MFFHIVKYVGLNALAFAKGRGLPLQKIQLTNLTHRDDPSLRNPDWKSLMTLLTELVGHAPVLQLFRSDIGFVVSHQPEITWFSLVLNSYKAGFCREISLTEEEYQEIYTHIKASRPPSPEVFDHITTMLCIFPSFLSHADSWYAQGLLPYF